MLRLCVPILLSFPKQNQAVGEVGPRAARTGREGSEGSRSGSAGAAPEGEPEVAGEEEEGVGEVVDGFLQVPEDGGEPLHQPPPQRDPHDRLSHPESGPPNEWAF